MPNLWVEGETPVEADVANITLTPCMFHYNAWREDWGPLGKMLIHYKRKKYSVDHIDCRVPSKSYHREEQPKIVMLCYARSVKIRGNTAIIEG